MLKNLYSYEGTLSYLAGPFSQANGKSNKSELDTLRFIFAEQKIKYLRNEMSPNQFLLGLVCEKALWRIFTVLGGKIRVGGKIRWFEGEGAMAFPLDPQEAISMFVKFSLVTIGKGIIWRPDEV